MKQRFARVLRHLGQSTDFMKLWMSDTIAVFGSQITLLALPLTAALLLRANPAQMGILVAMEMLPVGLFSLHAGAIIDRCRKLLVIKFAAFSRGVLLLVIPLSAYCGRLSIEMLYAVAFLMSAHAVFADLAYQAVVAKLVQRNELVDANAKFGLSESSADIAGPSLAGILVQCLTAPLAIVIDALGFLVSGLLLSRIKLEEPRPSQRTTGATLWAEIRAGLAAVWANAILRSLALLLAAWQFLHHMFIALFVLFAVRELGMSSGVIGIMFTMSGIGYFVGALYVRQLSRALGLGPTMLLGMFATTLGWMLTALVQGVGVPALAGLSCACICQGLGAALFFLTYISLRQGITSEALLGRVIATTRFISIAATPLGALFGGALGGSIGLRATIAVVGVAGIALSATATLYSPLKPLKQMPEPMSAETVVDPVLKAVQS
jgi:MFS family permease